MGQGEQDEVDFAVRAFELARAGETGALAAYLDGGIPVDLANDLGPKF